jgi:hypothetical protein
VFALARPCSAGHRSPFSAAAETGQLDRVFAESLPCLVIAAVLPWRISRTGRGCPP